MGKCNKAKAVIEPTKPARVWYFREDRSVVSTPKGRLAIKYVTVAISYREGGVNDQG